MSAIVTWPVTRCKWCIIRTGAARWCVGGEWMSDLLVPAHHITDGICPECSAVWRAELKDKEIANQQSQAALNLSPSPFAYFPSRSVATPPRPQISAARGDRSGWSARGFFRACVRSLFSHARLHEGQVASLDDGSRAGLHVGRHTVLSAALVRVVQFISRRRVGSLTRRRFLFFIRHNRRAHRLGRLLSLSHREWGLSR